MVLSKTYLELEPEDNQLLGSLHTIQYAINSIWTPNVSIIKDFTDHGMEHSFRVLNRAASLLKILKGRTNSDLSNVERYLLSACGYLHDIGMQCDIMKFPQVKAVAESLGADFADVNFDADYSSSYSNEAQIKIRENHQYLTAAWIQCAYDNRDPSPVSGLDDAAKTIPPLLVRNLMEICMYHSKLPIRMSFEPCKHERSTRIQLVAALLRFADELDVDLYRVPEPEKIHRNFRLPVSNIKYWWSHGRTHIDLDYKYVNEKITEGKITFEVLLHPDDIQKYGVSMQEEIIEKFKNKNKELLNILASSGIPISIDDESKVSGDSHLERMPKEISEELTMK